MGLLSRMGKNLAQFGSDRNSTSHMAAGFLPGAMAGGLLGGTTGAFMDANSGAEPGGEGSAFLPGAGIGAAALGAIGPGVAAKRVIMALAQALKRQAPQAPDEMVMQKAQQLMQNPTPEVQRFMQEVMGQGGGGMPPGGGMGGM